MRKSDVYVESFPIDSGGVVQLITGIKEQTPAFLIEYETREMIDRVKLRTAVNKALAVFCPFRVKLVWSDMDRRPVFTFNIAEADAYPYDGQPHAFGEESSDYLFRVYYVGSKILLSMDHTLTDFFGAHEFLKCILCFYFEIADGCPEEICKLLAVDPDDFRDPYALYGSTDSRGFSSKNKWQNELEIPNRMLYRRGEPIKVHELVFLISDYLKISKRAESSVFPLLTWLMGKAVAKTYGGEDKLLTGSGSYNCRSMFDSRTPKGFSQTFTTVLHPRERDMDMDAQLTVQRARMDIELEKETISRSLAARKEMADHILENVGPYILDQDKLDAERRASARRSTYFLSYLGHMEAGTALENNIENVSVVGSVTRVPIVADVWEWKGLLHFRTLEIGCENSIAPAVLEIADGLGIEGRLMAPFEKRLDYFPLEELYHG